MSPLAPMGFHILRSGGSEGSDKSKSVKEKQGKKRPQSGVETQVKWLKKLGKLYYGYKNLIEGGKME
ncbi:MAG: hypothetical protein ACMUEL_05685 [Flavobacteriales bacterium Tduv]